MSQEDVQIDLRYLLGKGLYSIPDAARILHAQPVTVRRWLEGYRDVPAMIYTAPLRIGNEMTVTFGHLVELAFLQLFRKKDQKVPPKIIRQAARFISRQYQTDYPFALHQLYVGDRSILIERSEEIAEGEENQYLDLGRMGQTVMEIAKPFLRKVDYAGSEIAQRLWPLGPSARIVIDPQRSFGAPIDADSGIPTSSLYSMFLAERSVTVVADWYGINARAVEDAVAFEAQLDYRGQPLLAA